MLCLVIVLNTVLKDDLYLRSLNFIYGYQNDQPQKAIQVIQNLISFMCSEIGIASFVFLYYIISKRKLMRLIHISFLLFAIYISGVLKQALQKPRPTWYDTRIESWEWFCPKDFGSPSGHCFFVIVLYEPIVTDSIGLRKFRIMLIPLILLVTLMPISRMYLGVHSGDQVLFGICLGLTYLTFYRYVGQEALSKLFWGFLLGNASKKAIKIVLVVFLNVITLVLPIIFFLVNRSQNPLLEKYVLNINATCE